MLGEAWRELDMIAKGGHDVTSVLYSVALEEFADLEFGPGRGVNSTSDIERQRYRIPDTMQ